MSFDQHLRRLSITAFWAVLGLLSFVPSVQANVYATNIKLNGSSTGASVPSGSAVSISYILNEPASSITVNILSGTTVVRSLTSTNTDNTSRGFNNISWNGLDNSGQKVPLGNYGVTITAASTGYTNWTQITSDLADTNTCVLGGQGIAVDRNPGSQFYGRVFVANAWQGSDPGNVPGDAVGILKFNTDTSGADEGTVSSGSDGYDWTGAFLSPWKVQVSTDDNVYVSDLAAGGDVYRWDPTMSSNSLLTVLRQDNRVNGTGMFGPVVAGSGTNTQIWMTDTNSAGTQGLELRRWALSSTGACATNDLGTIIITGGSNLNLGPAAAALDKLGNMYLCQFVSNPGDPLPRVFRFPSYDPSTNGGQTQIAPDWAVGTNNDTYAGASDIAVDPSGTYVAVAFQGTFDPTVTNGNTKVLYATNGAVVVDVDLDIDIDGIGDPTHQDTACAWDAVGNLYYIDTWVGSWRAVSPPGTNSSTTVSPAVLQVVKSTGGGGSAPVITGISISKGTVLIDFSAETNDVASSFVLLGASSAAGPYSLLSSATITAGAAPGQFQATVASSAGVEFYRIQRVGGSTPPQQPEITSLTLAGGTVIIHFTGSSSDLPSAFTLLSAGTAAGPYAAAASATITAVGAAGTGKFQAVAPATGPVQFYRIQK
jgi:hypothetical protein